MKEFVEDGSLFIA